MEVRRQLINFRQQVIEIIRFELDTQFIILGQNQFNEAAGVLLAVITDAIILQLAGCRDGGLDGNELRFRQPGFVTNTECRPRPPGSCMSFLALVSGNPDKVERACSKNRKSPIQSARKIIDEVRRPFS